MILGDVLGGRSALHNNQRRRSMFYYVQTIKGVTLLLSATTRKQISSQTHEAIARYGKCEVCHFPLLSNLSSCTNPKRSHLVKDAGFLQKILNNLNLLLSLRSAVRRINTVWKAVTLLCNQLLASIGQKTSKRFGLHSKRTVITVANDWRLQGKRPPMSRTI